MLIAFERHNEWLSKEVKIRQVYFLYFDVKSTTSVNSLYIWMTEMDIYLSNDAGHNLILSIWQTNNKKCTFDTHVS